MDHDHDSLPHRRFPCVECPWRRDVPPGKFSQDRYDDLAATTGTPGNEAPIGAPIFACHKTEAGRDQACAGWLAIVGHQHLGVRIAVIQGRLPGGALEPGPDWPDLFDSYEQMADRQAR